MRFQLPVCLTFDSQLQLWRLSDWKYTNFIIAAKFVHCLPRKCYHQIFPLIFVFPPPSWERIEKFDGTEWREATDGAEEGEQRLRLDRFVFTNHKLFLRSYIIMVQIFQIQIALHCDDCTWAFGAELPVILIERGCCKPRCYRDSSYIDF